MPLEQTITNSPEEDTVNRDEAAVVAEAVRVAREAIEKHAQPASAVKGDILATVPTKLDNSIAQTPVVPDAAPAVAGTSEGAETEAKSGVPQDGMLPAPIDLPTALPEPFNPTPDTPSNQIQ